MFTYKEDPTLDHYHLNVFYNDNLIGNIQRQPERSYFWFKPTCCEICIGGWTNAGEIMLATTMVESKPLLEKCLNSFILLASFLK